MTRPQALRKLASVESLFLSAESINGYRRAALHFRKYAKGVEDSALVESAEHVTAAVAELMRLITGAPADAEVIERGRLALSEAQAFLKLQKL